MNSRSVLQITQAFASRVDVHAAHLKDHSAWPSLDNAPATEGRRQYVGIQRGKEKPANTFAAVRCRDHWFWVDNGDLQSKSSLTMVTLPAQ